MTFRENKSRRKPQNPPQTDRLPPAVRENEQTIDDGMRQHILSEGRETGWEGWIEKSRGSLNLGKAKGQRPAETNNSEGLRALTSRRTKTS